MVEDQDQIVRFNNTFPPGFRFHPFDEELIVHYLKKKINSLPLPAPIVAEIDLYRESLVWRGRVAFLQPLDRKYPNGLRPNRAAGCGYWKATGTDKPVLTRCGSKIIGVKKALVFYSGRPPKATKTDWIMNEYRLVDTTRKPSSGFKGSMRLDDGVLCRVRYKGYPSNQRGENQENHRCGSKLNLPTITDYQIFASVSPQITIPSLDYGCFDSLKRTSNEDSQRGNVISFDSSCRPNPENKIDNLPDSNCSSSQSLFNEGVLIGQRILDPSINFQELNELPFTAGRFMQ